MTRVAICSWCDINVSENVFINYPGSDKLKRSFCSEKCFELSRRASFKRGKACDWCDKISLIENGTKSGSEYSSNSKLSNKSESSESNENGGIASIEHLHFCNNLCLNNYKKNVFEKETSDVLLVKKEDHIGDIDVETVSISTKQSDDKKISVGVKSSPFPTKVVKNISITPLKKSRCSSFTKFQKSNKRVFSNENSHSNPIQNLKTHNINPIYHSFNNYNDFLSARPNPSLGNFNLQSKSNDAIKIPVSGPLYIPVPIPIPIPIFKNAPEIIDILYKYGYRQTQNVKETQASKSPIISTNKSNQSSLITNSEPQTEALDLSGFAENRIENPSQNQINLTTSFPITSILHLNDPYLKRRNRILDAPTPPSLSGFSYSSRIKNYSLNYAEISSSAQLKPAKYSKKKMEKSPNYKTLNKTQSPRPSIQTAKSLLRRYPLISFRRNIKSAPSSVIDANIK